AVKKAREDADDLVILDTAGRLQINHELMAELEQIKARVPVTETLFVADAMEAFYPDRVASRILGMGDVLSLIEKTQEHLDQQKAAELEKKMRTATFGLDDFLDQLQQIKKMGPLTQVMEMIPGMSGLARKLGPGQFDESQLKRVEAIIYSMTPGERRNPRILDGSRKRRIARGSGTTPHDINQVINQFSQMQALMKQFTRGRIP